MTLSKAEGHFCILNLCHTHNSGNISLLNYSVFTHKLESVCSLWFKLYCQRWRTFLGHRSELMQKAARCPCDICGRGVGNNLIHFSVLCQKWVHKKCRSVMAIQWAQMRMVRWLCVCGNNCFVMVPCFGSLCVFRWLCLALYTVFQKRKPLLFFEYLCETLADFNTFWHTISRRNLA